MTTTVVPLEVVSRGVGPVRFTVLLSGWTALVRYRSVIEPDAHFDVLEIIDGQPQWRGMWASWWPPEVRDALIADVLALIRRT